MTETPATALAACPFCGTVEHLSVSKCGSLTGDMPDRPYRVVCDHIDHDQVQGPVAYGRYAAIAAWNTRAPQAGDELARDLRQDLLDLEELAEHASEPLSERLLSIIDRARLKRTPSPAEPVTLDAAANRIRSLLFEICQPDRGDVFSWCDDHAEEIARAALADREAPAALVEGAS